MKIYNKGDIIQKNLKMSPLHNFKKVNFKSITAFVIYEIIAFAALIYLSKYFLPQIDSDSCCVLGDRVTI